jgi:excisionase family DNA binding protein
MSAESRGLDDSFLTVAEVAAILQLNQQTVRNWIDQGSLPALRVGRRVRIRRSDLERVLDAGSTTPAANPSEPQGPTAEDFWGGGSVGALDEFVEADGRQAGATDGDAHATDGQVRAADGHPGVRKPEPT